MCCGIVIYKQEKIANEIYTIKQAADFFGVQYLRYLNSNVEVNTEDEYCLCSIDTDYLLENSSYVKIGEEDSRYTTIDIVVEKTQENLL